MQTTFERSEVGTNPRTGGLCDSTDQAAALGNVSWFDCGLGPASTGSESYRGDSASDALEEGIVTA
jgi:hypothetical protein